MTPLTVSLFMLNSIPYLFCKSHLPMKKKRDDSIGLWEYGTQEVYACIVSILQLLTTITAFSKLKKFS